MVDVLKNMGIKTHKCPRCGNKFTDVGYYWCKKCGYEMSYMSYNSYIDEMED